MFILATEVQQNIEQNVEELDKKEIDKIICLGDFIGRNRKIRRCNTENIRDQRKMYMHTRK